MWTIAADITFRQSRIAHCQAQREVCTKEPVALSGMEEDDRPINVDWFDATHWRNGEPGQNGHKLLSTRFSTVPDVTRRAAAAGCSKWNRARRRS
jgi:hypothetical protein